MKRVKIFFSGVMMAALIIFGAASMNKADAKVMSLRNGDLLWKYTIDVTVQNGDASDIYLDSESTISSDITIPSTFTDEYGTHEVKSLGRSTISGADSFFDGCEFSFKVLIDIDASGCTGLERVNGYAFYEKTRIDKIMLPKTVSSFGENICVSCADTTIYTENPNIVFEGSYDGKVRFNAPFKSTALDFVGTSRYTSNGSVTYRIAFNKVNDNAALTAAPLKTYAYVGADRELAALTAVPELPWYDFDGYYTERDGKGTKYYDSKGRLLQDVTEDMTLYAHYIPNDFTITYYDVEDYEIAAAPKKYTYASGIATLYQPERVGYTFKGWYDNADFAGNSVNGISDTEHGDKEYYAKWEANQYRVKFIRTMGVSGSMEEQIVKYGEKVYLSPVNYTKPGYDFYQWNTKEDGSGVFYENQQEIYNLATEMDAAITLYPIFHASRNMPVKVSVTYKALPGQEDEVLTDTIYGVTEEELLIDPAVYAKKGFVTPGKCLLIVDANEKYNKAEFLFRREEYQVTLKDSVGVKEVEGLGTYQYGQTAILKPVPEEGYAVTGSRVVQGSGKGTEAVDGKLTVRILEDTQIAVETEGISYGISYELNGGIFRSEDYVKKYTHGQETMLPTNVSKKGFSFIGWYDEAGKKVEKIDATETGSKVYFAKYGEGIYSIHYNTDGGSLNGNYAKTYKYNTGATLPSEENISRKGYSFLGWWDGKSVVNKIAKTDSEDKDLFALWQSNSTTAMTVINGMALEEVETEAKEISLAAATTKNTGYYYKQLNTIEKRLYNTLYNVYKFIPSEKKIQYDGCLDVITTETMTAANGYSASVAFILDHPEIYWLVGFGVSSFDKGKELRFSPYAAYSAYRTDAEMYSGYFSKALKSMGISGKDSAYIKVKKINNYICREYSYDKYGYTLNENTANDTRSVGRMLANKIGCCVGYAKLMKVFCDYFGIECILVRGGNHQWNHVQLNGIWYIVDVTWNDGDKNGLISTDDWFLIGTKRDGKNHKIENNWCTNSGKPITEYAYFNVPPLSSTDYKVPTTLPAKNMVKTVGTLKYKVTKSAAKNGTVSVAGVKSRKIKKVTIPATVNINGFIFKVTAVGSKAFYNCKKLKSVVIGKNVTAVGSKAFYRAKVLKKITIKGKGMKKIGRNALKGISKQAVIKLPKAKKKVYKKLLGRKTGFSNGMKLK